MSKTESAIGFFACVDPAGESYFEVMIGSRTWHVAFRDFVKGTE
jgi:hypothetical protein